MQDLSPRTLTQLRAEGWSTRRVAQAVRDGQLIRPTYGMYAAATKVTDADAHLNRARAILMRQSASAVLSHTSAAVAHGLPLPQRNPATVHFTVAPPVRGRRRPGYQAHGAALDADEVVSMHGILVTSLERTVIDVMRSSPYLWAVIAADWALNQGVSREAMLSYADEHPGCHGVPVLRQAALFADIGGKSPAESASRVSIARAGLPAPVLQFEVMSPYGWEATSDFAWLDQGVVGEVDGKSKYGRLLQPGQTAEEAIMAEKARDERIRQAGWWPVHWDWATAFTPSALAILVRGAFEDPAARRIRHRSC
ncbi:MAG: type IV toxin-antitoxin system AbiEi family antitoxin domain-containing protein [Propioniciclava sp.]|uniref:type IV toxin-antitoxin system AbiEi family antitoxin domain-containing protein n=1 Tax=Propioniciclava sp. TaxID=2038686 RepID=UPI0039E33D67